MREAMRIKQGLKRVKWQGRIFLLSSDARAEKTPLGLNETADRILLLLASDISREALLSALAEEYNVDEDTLTRDLDLFIEQLRALELLED